jgi:glycosyltransferase involved in cell wall biosynthesis
MPAFKREIFPEGRHGLFFFKKTANLSALIAGWDVQEEWSAEFRGRARQRILDAYSWARITAQYRRLFAGRMAGSNAQ